MVSESPLSFDNLLINEDSLFNQQDSNVIPRLQSFDSHSEKDSIFTELSCTELIAEMNKLVAEKEATKNKYAELELALKAEKEYTHILRESNKTIHVCYQDAKLAERKSRFELSEMKAKLKFVTTEHDELVAKVKSFGKFSSQLKDLIFESTSLNQELSEQIGTLQLQHAIHEQQMEVMDLSHMKTKKELEIAKTKLKQMEERFPYLKKAHVESITRIFKGYIQVVANMVPEGPYSQATSLRPELDGFSDHSLRKEDIKQLTEKFGCSVQDFAHTFGGKRVWLHQELGRFNKGVKEDWKNVQE